MERRSSVSSVGSSGGETERKRQIGIRDGSLSTFVLMRFAGQSATCTKGKSAKS
jgi:hypothetical protein